MSAPLDSSFQADVAETLDFLASPAAKASLEADPYWPKWDAPWWRLLILLETLQSVRVPRATVIAFSKAIGQHYLPTFPFKLDEIPAVKDPQRHILCLCALGSAEKILRASGIDLATAAPWSRSWYTRYQLPDGGWNCDEQAYTKPTPHSSIVSTLPMLEALLERGDGLTPEEGAALDRGARYLLDRRLIFSISKGRVADDDWLRPCFPRFYEYDMLRGLSFVIRWSGRRRRPLPEAAIADVMARLEAQASGGKLVALRRVFDGPGTIRLGPDGAWVKGAAGLFPLLEGVSRLGEPNPWLTAEWREAREGLERLRGLGLLA